MVSILYLTPFYPPDYAGGARLAHSVAKRLQTDPAFNFIVLTKQWEENTDKKEIIDIVDGITVIRVENGGKGIIGKFKSLWNIVCSFVQHRNQFNAIHFIGIPNEAIILTILGKILGKPMISTMELLGDDDLMYIKKSRLGFIKIQILRAHRIIGGLSRELLDISSSVSSLQSKLVELPNAIEMDRYIVLNPEDRVRVRKEVISLKEDEFGIVFCGAISKRKGVDLILQFIKDHELFLQNQNIKFILVGPLEDIELKEAVEHFTTKRLIINAGTKSPEDVIPFYQGSDLFVFPSRREGFGRVALEARACGLACLVSNIGPMQQIFEDGEDGILFENESYEDFEQKLLSLLHDRDHVKKLASKARDSIESKYTMVDLVERHRVQYLRHFTKKASL